MKFYNWLLVGVGIVGGGVCLWDHYVPDALDLICMVAMFLLVFFNPANDAKQQ